MAVYILRFSEPLGGESHQAQHYVGYTQRPMKARLEEHRQGRGAKITAAAVERGYTLEVVWFKHDGTRTLEKQIKRWKNIEKWIRCNPPPRSRTYAY